MKLPTNRAAITIHATKPDGSTDEILIGAQFGDAYYVSVSDPALDAPVAAQRMMGHSPRWVRALMNMRNAIVEPLGLKTPSPRDVRRTNTIGTFPILRQSAQRVVLGFNDKHLDFRVIVDVAHGSDGSRVTGTTLVRTHNLLGRVYLAAIKPFHRVIVRAMLKQVLPPRLPPNVQ